MIELKYFELGEKITRPLLDDVKEIQEIITKLKKVDFVFILSAMSNLGYSKQYKQMMEIKKLVEKI